MIEREGALEPFGGERARAEDGAGVVDEHVDAIELAAHLGGERAHRRHQRQIGQERRAAGGAPASRSSASVASALSLVARDDDDLGAGAPELDAR